MAEIITKDSEEFKDLTGWIRRTGKAVEDATARIRPTIADEHYLTGDDVCAMLHISRRTLQTLRDEKAVPYTSIGGKLLYPESKLYEVLSKNYRDFRRFRK
ncbi:MULTISPECIES: helix-turn-helix domain-containing protein [Bacteroidales]|uniref:Helix-turn-helix domain-containing protein n=3 Tax=Bacteroidales TaxID=171549 RepID=A0A6G1ZLT5_9BACT|nr:MULTISPECIES: helix-turn-helix domain-containing protein [Bacteroidales]MRX94960.1 helix-turn-helix domain-containing protein [Parabacteroides goldsteinii]MRY00497.1 helix-turn-helix domain-containing protein [Parabacteroides goldsteinii]MRY05651.1 helix-turn-helix domain-containing protein [Parabacteroides goldsteinii]MRY14924.1 helix-turn-helix domain-containing protein [Parabacteroides goldsteinii]MRY24160.1 helix-turn-helix domain-containing protein [Parabacteroides goldsteinii]